MSKFNTPSESTKVENFAGGKAYKQSAELELVSILLTSFVQDQAYRKEGDTTKRLKELIEKCNKEFVAKAGIYARTKFGMRSITHLLASELAKYLSGKEWAKNFYDKIIYRPDDMLEILAYHYSVNAKKGKNGKGMLTNAMRKGFASAFNRYDSHSLAKYKGDGKTIKLIDVVNAVRPIPTEKNAEALAKLIKGELISTETWEAKLSKAGQVGETAEEVADLKKEVWSGLIKEKKILAFALLRNLRNILKQAPEMVNEACELLVDENRIKKSLILPFRYVSALREIEKETDGNANKIVKALNRAVDISCSNVPKFEGNTLVAIDASGSMSSGVGGGEMDRRTIATLFGCIMAKRNDADIMLFGDTAKLVSFNGDDSTLTLTKQIASYNGMYSGRDAYSVGHGTNYNAVFETAKKKYDRIIFFSDCQGWMGGGAPDRAFAQYRTRTGAKPFVYSVDLAGLGTMMFPEQNVFCMAGYSEKIFTLMGFLEQDKEALINEILKVEL